MMVLFENHYKNLKSNKELIDLIRLHMDEGIAELVQEIDDNSDFYIEDQDEEDMSY